MTTSGMDAGPSEQPGAPRQPGPPPQPSPPPQPGSSPQPGSATDTTRDKARQVGESAAGAGRDVASTTRDEAGAVAQEARQQARNLAAEARDQATRQVDNQRDQLAKSLHGLGDELRGMAERGQQSGVAAEVARQLADRTHDLASYLDQHSPGDLVEEVRELARRRPGAFLLGAAVAGVVVGRLTRGAVSAASQQSGPPSGPSSGLPAGSEPTSQPAASPPRTLQEEAMAQPGQVPPGGVRP